MEQASCGHWLSKDPNWKCETVHVHYVGHDDIKRLKAETAFSCDIRCASCDLSLTPASNSHEGWGHTSSHDDLLRHKARWKRD